MNTNKELSPEESLALLNTLKASFKKNADPHKEIEWNKIQSKLEANPGKLLSLNEMERTGGEPDVDGYEMGLNLIMQREDSVVL